MTKTENGEYWENLARLATLLVLQFFSYLEEVIALLVMFVRIRWLLTQIIIFKKILDHL